VIPTAQSCSAPPQLIDALSGHHLWANPYDRELADVF
jgi:TolB-like protein